MSSEQRLASVGARGTVFSVCGGEYHLSADVSGAHRTEKTEQIDATEVVVT